MKPPPQIQYLKALEKRYLDALTHVQFLIEMESGQTIQDGQPASQAPSATQPGDDLTNLTKGDAAEIILRDAGRDLHKKDILFLMQKRGHPIKEAPLLVAMLSADKKRFVSKGNGIWGLKQ